MAVHKRLLCYAVFAVGLLCMILACGDDEGALTATALSNGIRLENGTGHNVGFLLVEQETSAVELGSCVRWIERACLGRHYCG